MSTHIMLLRDPADMDYQNKLNVLYACQKAEIEIPKEIDDYFGGEEDPDYPLEIQYEPDEWSDEGREGFEIELSKLPEGVKRIRFYNSW